MQYMGRGFGFCSLWLYRDIDVAHKTSQLKNETFLSSQGEEIVYSDKWKIIKAII